MFMFWLGLLLAFPLSIAANLLTPNVNRLLLKWNETRRDNYEQRAADEQEEITRILSHPFRFYRYLLSLIYGHLFILTLFFLVYWICSTAPHLLAFAHSITGTHIDREEIARFAELFAQLNAVLAMFCTLVFMLLVTKTSRAVKKLLDEAAKV
jgi:hypothetical protein